MTAVSIHTSVLPVEVLSFLALRKGARIVDGTLGGGGHTRLLAKAVGPDGLVIAIDRDPAAIEIGARELAGLPVRFAQANYCDIPEVLDALSLETVDGVLLDVGLSSDQLADDSRGFSFDADGPLDLRFDPTEGEPAWRMLNRLKADHLADLIHEFGEERYSRRIARRIVAAAANPSGHANLSGLKDCRQSGTQVVANCLGKGSQAIDTHWPDGGDFISLLRRPAGETGVSQPAGLGVLDSLARDRQRRRNR